MNQEKIGKYIATCRKNKKLTQEQLAEKLGITSKSISRWENGKTMPDVSLFHSLCKELSITINDLLSGETTSKNNLDLSADKLLDYSKYIKKTEKKKLIILSIGLIILIGLFLIVIIKGVFIPNLLTFVVALICFFTSLSFYVLAEVIKAAIKYKTEVDFTI